MLLVFLQERNWETNDMTNILLIEDNPGDARLVKELLQNFPGQEIKLYTAASLSQGLKLIASELIHVILLDLNLPDSEGLQTFKQTHKFAMNVPIIIMSVISDHEIIFQAMKEGAQDYLIKGQIENEALIRGIRYAIWSYHAVQG